MALAISLSAFFVSLCALTVAIWNYRRKTGVLMQASYAIGSEVNCNDCYVSSIVLENLKDRSITIFGIYLRVGWNYYIEIEEFDHKNPLVLKAFETYQKGYGPIQRYHVNLKRIRMDDVLRSERMKKRIVISTSVGKCVAKQMRSWSPVGDFFENHMTASIHPIRIKIKDKFIGEGILYAVEFFQKEISEVILFSPRDCRTDRFKNIDITEAALASKSAFAEFLDSAIREGKIVCTGYKIHDINEIKQDRYDGGFTKEITAKPYSWFSYYVWGKIWTWLDIRRLRRRNARRNRK